MKLPDYITHSDAVKKIASELKLDEKKIDNVVRLFFSKYGIERFFNSFTGIRIRGFGTFMLSKTGRIERRRRDRKRKMDLLKRQVKHQRSKKE